MLYCEGCQRLIAPRDGADCPECGQGLREAQENDSVLLVTVPSMQATTFVEPLLKDSGIPYAKSGALGVGFTMRAGSMLEEYRFYVPFGAYAGAHDLIASAYGEDPLIMQGLQ